MVASPVIVNQLVGEDACVSDAELAELEKWGSTPSMSEPMKLDAKKKIAAVKLTSSRHAIQSKYLKELKDCNE